MFATERKLIGLYMGLDTREQMRQAWYSRACQLLRLLLPHRRRGCLCVRCLDDEIDRMKPKSRSCRAAASIKSWAKRKRKKSHA